MTLRADNHAPVVQVNLSNSDPVVNFGFGKIMEFNARRGIVDGAGFMLTNATKQVRTADDHRLCPG